MFVMRCLSLFVAVLTSVSVAYGEGSIFVKEVEGRGKDDQAALVDAFQNAIRKALGTYVVTHATTDGETLDEKIYLNSDAVVKNYKVVGREDGDGFVSLLINAEIVRNEMMKYIQRVASEKVDGGELANLQAKRNALASAVKSLDLLFLDYRENLFRVEKYGNMSIASNDDLSGERVMVSVPFVLTFRWDAYRVWRDKLTQLLDRIAIAKTAGGCKNLDEFEVFYDESRFFEENGVAGNNPNGYRGVLFLDGGQERTSPIAYTIYVVPSQIYKKLVELLDSEVDYRFTFTSSGGNDIASFYVSGKVWFFENTSMKSFSPHFGDSGCVVFYKELFANCGRVDQQLFHATIPIPTAVLNRIEGVIIRCVPREERKSWEGVWRNRISSTPLSKAEYLSIDSATKVVPTVVNGSNPRSTKNAVTSSNNDSNTTSSGNPLPGFDKVLNVLMVAQVSPTVNNVMALENCWGSLPKELRPMLQTNILNASCASFLARGNMGAVAKRKDRIDSAALWVAATDECQACHGSGNSETKCFACEGRGVCSYCRGSGKLGGGKPLAGMASEAASMRCHHCNGSGRCQSCKNGRQKTRCTKCDGKGRVVSKAKCKTFFEQNIGQAIRICRGEG